MEDCGICFIFARTYTLETGIHLFGVFFTTNRQDWDSLGHGIFAFYSEQWDWDDSK